MTILIDMDDVLENLCEEWVKYLNEKYNTKVNHDDITEWDMTKFFPNIDKKELYEPLFKDDFWRRVKPKPHSVKYLKQLIDDGHTIYIVTSSHFDTLSMKFNLVLYKYFPYINYKNIVITDKKQIVIGDVLIDDAPHNLEGGVYKGLLFDAPHNKSYNEKENGIVRVYDWREIYQYIEFIEDFRRLGYDINESFQLAESAFIYT